MNTALPTGTITFLFTDIEGNTKLWETHPEAMQAAVARHDVLLQEAIVKSGGYLVKSTGDGVVAAFHTAADALHAALSAQQVLTREVWPPAIHLLVRMGLHTGTAELRGGDYFGPALNRAARLMASGYGGQVLLSEAAQELCRDVLPDSAGLRHLGEHRLKDLTRPETVYQLLHPDLPDNFAALRTINNIPNNLPQQVTSFIGQEQTIASVTARLHKTRLLTLTGSGGSGKTRLALQVAADVLDEYPDGAWLIEFAPLSDPALVPQTVASVLGVKEQAGQTVPQTLTEHLKNKRLLLLLDNCEHLLSACAQFTASVLRSCPHVRVLVTSREPSGIAGEATFRVPSLSLPDPKQAWSATPASLNHYEAVRLFIERAQSVKNDFTVTNANAPALAQLCHQLDGIPLALELAAARVRSLSVEDINTRLDGRFRLLTGGDRAALPRQQTLRALVDWSYDLLTNPEKALLHRLSVFAGGWTLSAAESVCGLAPLDDVLDLLTSLVDKSLVQVEESGGNGSATRYRMLETLKQYAAEKRDAAHETPHLKNRHRDYFVHLAEDAEPKLKGPEQAAWLSYLECEHDNLRAALDWCAVTGENEVGLRLAGALWWFWMVRGYLTEGREQLSRALSQVKSLPDWCSSASAKALNGAGHLAKFQGDYGAARSLAEEGLSIYRGLDDKEGVAAVLINLGLIAHEEGDLAMARALYEECLFLNRELQNKRGIAASLTNLGTVASDQGDYGAARTLAEEGLVLYREVEDKQGVASSLINLGLIAQEQGDYKAAQQLNEECLVICRELQNKRGIAGALMNLGNGAFHQSDTATAQSRYEDCLVLYRELGDKRGVASALINLGNGAYGQNDHHKARSLYEESLVIHRELGDKSGIALVLGNLAAIACEQSDYKAARRLNAESLVLRRELGDKRGMAYSLEGLASVGLGENAAQYALVLLGAAHALREKIGAPLTPTEQAEQAAHIEKARLLLTDERSDISGFTLAWEQGRALTWEQAADFALTP